MQTCWYMLEFLQATQNSKTHQISEPKTLTRLGAMSMISTFDKFKLNKTLKTRIIQPKTRKTWNKTLFYTRKLMNFLNMIHVRTGIKSSHSCLGNGNEKLSKMKVWRFGQICGLFFGVLQDNLNILRFFTSSIIWATFTFKTRALDSKNDVNKLFSVLYLTSSFLQGNQFFGN